MNLSHLTDGATAYVTATKGSPSLRIRLEELGFVPGQEVTRVYGTPGGSPAIYAMLGQRVALRHSEAQLIEVSTERPDENYADERRVARTPGEKAQAPTLPTAPEVAAAVRAARRENPSPPRPKAPLPWPSWAIPTAVRRLSSTLWLAATSARATMPA